MLSELIILILKTAFSIVLIALVARFLAQLARADSFNPIAQTVLQITQPFIKPLQRLIPPVGGFNLASLVAIWLGQVFLAMLMLLLVGQNPLELLAQLMIWGLVSVAGIFLMVLQWSMIIVAVGSWLTAMGQPNPLLSFLAQLVEPFIGPFRRLNLQVGMLDLSYLLAFFVLLVLRDFVLYRMILPSINYYETLRFISGDSLFVGL